MTSSSSGELYYPLSCDAEFSCLFESISVKFPELQRELKTVMSGEMEVVIKEERYICWHLEIYTPQFYTLQVSVLLISLYREVQLSTRRGWDNSISRIIYHTHALSIIWSNKSKCCALLRSYRCKVGIVHKFDPEDPW